MQIKTKLNPRQLLFLQTYLKIGNASQALIKAGYKTKYPQKVASALLNKPFMKDALDKNRQLMAHKTEITFEYKLHKLNEIVNNVYANSEVKIKAIEVMNKMQGDNAPEKHHNTNVNVDVKLEDARAISEQYFNDYQAKIDKE